MKKYLFSIAAIVSLAVAFFSFREKPDGFEDVWNNYTAKVDALIASGDTEGPEVDDLIDAIHVLNSYDVDAEVQSRFPSQHYCVMGCYYQFYNCVAATTPTSGGGEIGWPVLPFCTDEFRRCIDRCGL
jgi:hypothetical protein